MQSPRRKVKVIKRSLEQRIFVLFFWSGLPAALILILVLLVGDYSNLLRLTLIPLTLLLWLSIALFAKHTLDTHFRGLANVLEGLRSGDFTMRVSANSFSGSWSEVHQEINSLATMLDLNRYQTIESTLLLEKLIAEFDIPLFIIGRGDAVRNANNAAAQLFNLEKQELVGLSIQQLNLHDLFSQPPGEVVTYRFPSRGGRWEVRQSYFIQEGTRYRLLLINDLSRALREEERHAWQRLVRVLGHELNNSLASIKSTSETLQSQLSKLQNNSWSDSQWPTRFERGLRLISERGESLQRFTEAYTRLAKLPPPKLTEFDLGKMMVRLCGLTTAEITIKNNMTVNLHADQDQLEQLFINLIKNAAEANDGKGSVTILWALLYQGISIKVIDDGPGITNSDNLFVPFYTTKPNGNGIGLVFCRQIAEAHGGTLMLTNRQETSGCIAELWLPNSKIAKANNQ